MKKYLKPALYLLVAALIIWQFFPIKKSNPSSDLNLDFISANSVPDNIGHLLKSACYDCHSHHTKHPWYTNIQPIGWWIKGHIDNGCKHLNYSIWTQYDDEKKAHKMEEMIEEIEEKHMPLKSYTWLHPEARLSPEDRSHIIAWLKSL